MGTNLKCQPRFPQDVVESQEKGTEPTSIEPKNGQSKAVVQRDFGTGKSHECLEVVISSQKRLHQLLDSVCTQYTAQLLQFYSHQRLANHSDNQSYFRNELYYHGWRGSMNSHDFMHTELGRF